MSILGGQKRSKFDDEKVTQKVVKNDRFWRVKKWVKNDEKMTIFEGVPGGQNHQKSTGGSGGVHFINFLKICTFLQKLPHFRPPKTTL
jgi:hypothetical protein